MTREEFDEIVTNTQELIDFCGEYGFDNFVEDICSDADRDDVIDNAVREFLHHDYWYRLADILSDIETGWEFYQRGDGDFEWYGFGDAEYEDRREQLVEYLEEHDFFDDAVVEEDDEVEDSECEQEGISLDLFFDTCREAVTEFASAANRQPLFELAF